MGIIISRFRKKKSTLDILEGLEKEIKSIEDYGQSTERTHKAVVGRLVLVSVGLYVLTAVLFYFVFFPASLYDQLLYVIPLLLFPLIIIFVKRLVSWWYRRKLSRYREKLVEIRKQKKELLEEVMDKETYKVARQILEKFAPDQLQKGSAPALLVSRSGMESKVSNQLAISQLSTSSQVGTLGTSELRRRPLVTNSLSSVERTPQRPMSSYTANSRSPPPGVGSSSSLMTSESPSVIGKTSAATGVASDSWSTPKSSASAAASAIASATESDVDDSDIEEEEEEDEKIDNDVSGKDPPAASEVADDAGEKLQEDGPCEGPTLSGPTARLTRPILPQERSVVDRLVEYLVGDGVNQRYALICRSCNSHNGMALKEEFEYLAFRCCYCLHWNPARKQRLQAPRLEGLPSSGNTTTSSSPAESNTEEDEEVVEKIENLISLKDVKENKSEQRDRKVSTGSCDGVPAADDEPAESPSSMEVEFESLFPASSPNIPGGGDAPSQ